MEEQPEERSLVEYEVQLEYEHFEEAVQVEGEEQLEEEQAEEAG